MFDVLIKLRWFFKSFWKRYTVAVVLLIIASVIEILPPWILGQAIDAITLKELTPALLQNYILLCIVLIIVGYVLNFIWQ